MRNPLLLALVCASLLLQPLKLTWAHPAAQLPMENAAERADGEALCLPEAGERQAQDCLLSGPAEVMRQMSLSGMSIPPAPFPTRTLPASLAAIPYQYALVSDQSAPLYSSLAAARAGSPQRVLPPGKIYIAYSQRVEDDGQVFYQIQTGEWISGASISSRVGYSTASRGVLVTGIPRAAFGWTIDIVETRQQPGLDAPLTGREIPIYTLVWVYETVSAGGQDWVRLGLNEWAPKRLVGRVIHNPNPPQGVNNGRWIEINLYDQTISVYENSRLVFAALIASGIQQMATRPGLFQVTKKVPAEHMSGAFEADRSDYYYLESVPWTMYFDEARAIHGVYWRTSFGRQVSHGCVNMTIPDARWIYDWAEVGEWVYAWDEREQKP